MKVSKFNIIWLCSIGLMVFSEVLGKDVGALGFFVFVVCTAWYLFGLALTPFAMNVIKKDIKNIADRIFDSDEVARDFLYSFCKGGNIPLSPDQEEEIIQKAKRENGTYSKYIMMRHLIYLAEKTYPGAQKRVFKLMGVDSLSEMKEFLGESENSDQLTNIFDGTAL